MSRPLEGRLVSAVTEFAIEDYGSRQPSPGRVREGCLEAVALGAEAQQEPGVAQVAVGQSIGAGAQEKPRAWRWARMHVGGGHQRGAQAGRRQGRRLALGFIEATGPCSGTWRSFASTGPGPWFLASLLACQLVSL